VKVILVMAMTADGVIAHNSMEPVDWTGKADKQYFVRITRQAGVMIMGSRTFDTLGKALPGRKNIVITRDKTRKSRDNNLVFTDQTPEHILKGLEAEGFDTAILIGGSLVNTLFMEHNLVDEIHVTIVPKLFGTGLTLFNTAMDRSLELVDLKKMDQGSFLIIYRVVPV
jgi:dihydrofolate reductase